MATCFGNRPLFLFFHKLRETSLNRMNLKLHSCFNSKTILIISMTKLYFSAPGAFVIASKYDTDVDLIASSMVACTFISGPIIFISAKMISLTNLQPSDFVHELERFSFDICIVGILMTAALLILFVVTKKHRKMPHRVTCCLLISQIFVCVGVIIWASMGMTSIPGFYAQFVLYTFGCLSSRIWCGICAITLLFIQYRSLCFVLKLIPVFVSRKQK